MKKYNEFLNEGIFSFLNRDKKENENDKKKKYTNKSDSDMIDLIDDISKNFNINNLSKESKGWLYNHNKIKIIIEKYTSSYYLTINNNKVDTNLISEQLLKELFDFFKERDDERNYILNTNIFNDVISSRINAKKYNL